MDMQAFFSQCGEYLTKSHRTEELGTAKRFIVTFEYSNGTAEFDGRQWAFSLKRG